MSDRTLPIDDEYTNAAARITALESEVATLHDALDHEQEYSHSLMETVVAQGNQIETLKYGEVVARQLAEMVDALIARVEALEDRLDPERNPHE